MIQNTLKLPNGSDVRNRIVKSAMSEALGDKFNNPTDGLINLFGRWSKGGAGLLITGNTPVDRWHLEHAGNFVLDELSDMDRVRQLASAAKSGGAKDDAGRRGLRRHHLQGPMGAAQGQAAQGHQAPDRLQAARAAALSVGRTGHRPLASLR